MRKGPPVLMWMRCGVREVLVPPKQTVTEGRLLVACDGVVILVSLL